METAPLKSFATWARTTLIREVTARVAVVLAPGSLERVEQPKAIAALESAVSAAGGGEKGRAAIADRVAYTWFNRIIALRFMDANRYTGIGVVSPAAGVEGGQPEILAEAKRGTIDGAVVGAKTRELVTGLLNGTRRSGDPEGEAFALLLTEYCRHWNRAMPFMFEREGDYTELLIPANLLAEDSVLSRAVKVLTTDVCQDVEVIGWLYQFYISERKDEVFAGFKKNKKAGAAEIPAATQLFTPHWIVRYLVENSVGRLWMLNHPSSRLVDQMDYYIAPVDDETDFLKISGPEELTVIDPACGSGHMLTYAFDLLYAIYEEEGYAPSEIPSLILTHNLHGTEIDPRAGTLAAFALMMKARARQRTFFNKQVEPSICVLESIRFAPQELDLLLTSTGDRDKEVAFWGQFEHADTLGSLITPDPRLTARLRAHVERSGIGPDDLYASVVLEHALRVIRQAEFLSPGYAVVVANPPYMGSKKMGDRLAKFAVERFPNSKADLFAMFIERCWSLAKPTGAVGMITMQSWMFLGSFKRLREAYVGNSAFSSLLHLGARAFGSIGGEVVSTAAWVWCPGASGSASSPFLDLTSGGDEAAKRDLLVKLINDTDDYRVYKHHTDDFLLLPDAILAYAVSHEEAQLFAGRRLKDATRLVQGLSTADNNRFLRLWYEVGFRRLTFGAVNRVAAEDSGTKWFPCNKGGPSRRWFGNRDYVVNWQHDGAEIMAMRPSAVVRNPDVYFRPAVSWSNVSGVPGFRYFPAGFIPNAVGNSLYVDGDMGLNFYLGVLNSKIIGDLLTKIAPTMHFEVGQVGELPLPGDSEFSEQHARVVSRLVEISTHDVHLYETDWEFATPCLLRQGTSRVPAAVRAELLREQEALRETAELERLNERLVAGLFRLQPDEDATWPAETILLRGVDSEAPEHRLVEELVSFSVGCMFGRYSLDVPGLILADQGATLRDYLARVQDSTFTPDTDNVIPIVDGDWFEDDIVARFREFLRVAFGEEHFEENLRFVTEALGVKNLRDYFLKSFYADHVKRYKKRPIYWLFSSPKGSFNALIYMHRYTPSTVSIVLNDYMREYEAKLRASLEQQERLAAGGGSSREQAAALKEAERLRKVLTELEEYEHDVLYPLASRQLAIDLDDGVKTNYPKFGAALKKIPGLEASDE